MSSKEPNPSRPGRSTRIRKKDPVDELSSKLATKLLIQSKSKATSTTKTKDSTEGKASSSSLKSAAASNAKQTDRLVTTAPPKPSSSKEDPSNTESQGVTQPHPWNEPDAASQAMSEWNAAAKSFGLIHESGWKHSLVTAASSSKNPSSSKAPHPFGSVETAAAACHSALQRVRATRADNKALDVEKAAITFTGKLITMELWSAALTSLEESRKSLHTLYVHDVPEEPSTSRATEKAMKKPSASRQPVNTSLASGAPEWKLSQHVSSHCFALPREGDTPGSDLLNILAVHQLHAMTALLRLAPSTSHLTIDEVLRRPGNLLDWMPVYSRSLESKKLQAITNSAARGLSNANCPPAVLLHVRLQGLRILLAAPKVDPASFWDQTTKCVKSFYKAESQTSTSTENDHKVAEEIQLFFTNVVHVADLMPNRSMILSGPQFVSAMEYWMQFAKWMKDLPALGRIARLINPENSSAFDESSTTDSNPALTGAKLRATLSRATIFIHQLSKNPAEVDDATVLHDATALLPRTFDLIRLDMGSESTVALCQNISTLVRGCHKVLSDSSTSLPHAIILQVTQVVSVVASGGEDFVQGLNWNDIVKRNPVESIASTALDGLLLLCSTLTRGKSDSNWANQVYKHLQSALNVLNLGATDVDTLAQSERICYAESLRAVSAAYHNAGARLLNDRKESASSVFWKLAAELGEKAWNTWSVIGPSKPEGDHLGSREGAESWTTLIEKHVTMRWDLLAFSYVKAGERRLAHQAYVQAILAHPSRIFTALSSDSASKGVRELFSSNDKLTQAIERVTMLAVFDLFLQGDEATLRKSLEGKGIPKSAIGSILEYQVIVLESVGHKEEAQVALKTLLKDLKELYPTGVYPIRRARVLMRSLELAYSTDDSTHAPSPVVVHGLLETKHLGEDSGLLHLVPQYSASLEMIITLNAHCQQHTDGGTSTILTHTDNALRNLREMLNPTWKSSETPLIESAQLKTKSAKKAPNATKSRKQALAPKTPKKKTAVDKLSSALETLQLAPTLTQVTIDDHERFHRMLENFANLLGLLGHIFPYMATLDIIRTLCQRSPVFSGVDGFVRASVQLAQEYMKLGKTDRAAAVYGQALTYGRTPEMKLSVEVRIVFLLRYAESLAQVNNTEKSLAVYMEASALARSIVTPDKSASTVKRVNARILTLERSALACNVFAAIQLARDDTTAAIRGLSQAVRLWNRAIQTLTRLQEGSGKSQGQKAPSSPNPFQVATQEISSVAKPLESASRVRDSMMDGVQWRLTGGLATTLFGLGKVYFMQGSVKSAEFFTQRARDLAASINAPVLLSRALGREAEIEIHKGKPESGSALLEHASQSWATGVVGPDLIDLHRLQGQRNVRMEQLEEAKEVYCKAREVVAALEDAFSQTDVVLSTSQASRRSSIGIPSSAHQDVIVPVILAAIFRQHIWLLRSDDDEESESEYNDLLARLLALPASVETKVEENTLMGKLRLEEVMARFQADLYLSSVTETVIALPMGMSNGQGASSLSTAREILAALGVAEDFFWSALELSSARGTVHQVRDAALSLVLIRAFQTSLGKVKKNGNAIVAALLDVSSSITLRRELLECIEQKIHNPSDADDLVWPAMASNASPILAVTSRDKQNALSFESDEEDIEPKPTMDKYWQMVRNRYRSETLDPASLATSRADVLPPNWTVVNIALTDDKRTMFISRQQPNTESLIFCLPLDRQGRREGDDDHFSVEKALQELTEIIQLSDQSIQNASSAVDKESRAAWWAERNQLDTRMKQLLENVEYCWLGAFKTILGEPTGNSPGAISTMRTKLEKVFRRNGISSQEKKSELPLQLDNTIVDCFSSLSPKCRDEELEDMAYFVLDLYQLHGVPVALSEIDIDQVCVDLRGALEEHHARARKGTPIQDHHLFLVLDKNIQGIPWESTPILRGRSVSRIPSISFLLDRLEMANYQRDSTPASSTIDRVDVDPAKAFYILNPSGDLATTQATYEPSFKELEKLGWNGITGRAPLEQELVQALTTNDLVLYFGHGGAQNYIRSHKLRELPRCAATMLWGCSSGAMHDMGDFDRVGIPNHYMLAGCPTLVANLWDVTDREIDKVAQAVLDKLHLNKAGLQPQKSRPKGQMPKSAVQAVAESREACKLKYLTGAAPVVYGIPFYL